MKSNPVEHQFLFIGTATPDAAISKLKTLRISYKQKRLDSGPENWQEIIELVRRPQVIGSIVKLTGDIYQLIVGSMYSEVAPRLFEALSEKPNVVFVHEAVLKSGEDSPEVVYLRHEDDELDFVIEQSFSRPSEETRLRVKKLLEKFNLNVLPYRTNAELAVIAAAFVDDNEKNLLFRVYVPSGRLYAAEADKLLTLFHDYLNQVGRFGVRQDGYSTAGGQVYEFFGNDNLSAHALTRHFNDFAKFLDKCVEDPTEAEHGLVSSGVERSAAPHLVYRYGKEARRLNTDLRQERETRILTLRHRFETELLDLAEAHDATRQVEQLIEAMVPKPHDFSPRMLLASGTQPVPSTINISQQVVHAAAGAIVHNVQGTAHFGTEAKLLLALIDRHDSQESEILTSAVHELEDPDARPVDRLTAKQRLKGFLYRVAQDLEKPAMAILQKYLESKLGL